MDDRLARTADARVAVLGTILPDGRPHLVPVTFALSGDLLVTAVDWKPKTGRTLRRVRNLEADPRATVLIHEYFEDWTELWWVRVDGTAELHHSGQVWAEAVAALVAKYDQYRDRPPEGAIIALMPERVVAWSGRP